jgi:two-component system sensor histidine kinase/response regulator
MKKTNKVKHKGRFSKKMTQKDSVNLKSKKLFKDPCQKIIFCLDDEALVLQSLMETLTTEFHAEFKIVGSTDPRKSLALIKNLLAQQHILPVVISDHSMPKMDGGRFFEELEKIAPNALKILLTGYASNGEVGDLVKKVSLFRFISKPWMGEDLLMTIRSAIKFYFKEEMIKKQSSEINEQRKQMIKMDKFAKLGVIVSGVVHEVKNSLVIAQGYAHYIKKEINYRLNDEKGEIPGDVAGNQALARSKSRRANLKQKNGEEGNESHGDRLKKYIDYQEKTLKNLGGIINGIRVFGRSDMEESANEAKVVKKEIKYFNIKTAIEETTRLVAILYKNYGVAINIQSITEDDEDLMVAGEANLFQQVLINLYSNSKDALEKSHKKVINVKCGRKGQKIMVEVVDTGEGIAKSNLSKIFANGHSSKPEGQGTGLGLGIVKNIIESMEGEIEVASKLGKGTTMIIKLPCKQ